MKSWYHQKLEEIINKNKNLEKFLFDVILSDWDKMTDWNKICICRVIAKSEKNEMWDKIISLNQTGDYI